MFPDDVLNKTYYRIDLEEILKEVEKAIIPYVMGFASDCAPIITKFIGCTYVFNTPVANDIVPFTILKSMLDYIKLEYPYETHPYYWDDVIQDGYQYDITTGDNCEYIGCRFSLGGIQLFAPCIKVGHVYIHCIRAVREWDDLIDFWYNFTKSDISCYNIAELVHLVSEHEKKRNRIHTSDTKRKKFYESRYDYRGEYSPFDPNASNDPVWYRERIEQCIDRKLPRKDQYRALLNVISKLRWLQPERMKISREQWKKIRKERKEREERRKREERQERRKKEWASRDASILSGIIQDRCKPTSDLYDRIIKQVHERSYKQFMNFRHYSVTR